MINTLRTTRRPAPGFAWRALALYAGPALLLAATVLPTVLLLDRLPQYEVPPYQQHPLNYLVGAVVFGIWDVVAWVVVFVVSLTSRHPNRRWLWELWVPLLYGLGGMTIALSVPPLALNLDRPYGLPPNSIEALGVPLTWAVILASAGVGLLLGRRAGATETAPRSEVRAIWIADVDADRSWWLLQGICALLVCLLFAVPYALGGNWSAALQWGLGLLSVLVVVFAWASRGRVVISPSGIRVHYGHIRLLGWEVVIDQIASVEVGRVRLLHSPAAWQCWSHLALRAGPALIIRTRTGGRRVVTVPQAEDAAATLRAWLAQRRASV